MENKDVLDWQSGLDKFLPRKSRILLCEGEGKEGQGSLKRQARMAQKGSLQAGIGRLIVIYERQLQSGSLEKDWGITVGKRGWYVWVILLTVSVAGRRIKMRGPFLPCCFKVEKGEWRSGPVGRRRIRRKVWIRQRGRFRKEITLLSPPTHFFWCSIQQMPSPTLRHAARRLTVRSLPSSVWDSKSSKDLASPVSQNCSKPVHSALWSSDDSYL